MFWTCFQLLFFKREHDDIRCRQPGSLKCLSFGSTSEKQRSAVLSFRPNDKVYCWRRCTNERVVEQNAPVCIRQKSALLRQTRLSRQDKTTEMPTTGNVGINDRKTFDVTTPVHAHARASKSVSFRQRTRSFAFLCLGSDKPLKTSPRTRQKVIRANCRSTFKLGENLYVPGKFD